MILHKRKWVVNPSFTIISKGRTPHFSITHEVFPPQCVLAIRILSLFVYYKDTPLVLNGQLYPYQIFLFPDKLFYLLLTHEWTSGLTIHQPTLPPANRHPPLELLRLHRSTGGHPETPIITLFGDFIYLCVYV